jgi:hypothetical protein
LEREIDLLMIPGGSGTRVLLSDDHPEVPIYFPQQAAAPESIDE